MKKNCDLGVGSNLKGVLIIGNDVPLNDGAVAKENYDLGNVSVLKGFSIFENGVPLNDDSAGKRQL